MRGTFAVTAVAFLGIAIPPPVSADEDLVVAPLPKIELATQSQAPSPTPPRSDPKAQALRQLQQLTQSAMAICGMTIVPTDPSVDPQMKTPIPSRGAVPTMRVATPPMCSVATRHPPLPRTRK